MFGRLVFVDSTSKFLPTVSRSDQNAAFNRPAQTAAPPGSEIFVPIVLSSEKLPSPDPVKPEDYTRTQFQQTNNFLAETLGTTNLIVSGSGHFVMLYDPKIVARQIDMVIDEGGSGCYSATARPNSEKHFQCTTCRTPLLLRRRSLIRTISYRAPGVAVMALA